MKKIKRLFSSAKNNSDNASFRGSLGKRNSSLSSIAGQSLNYDLKPKDLDKIHKAVLNQDEKKVELLAPKYVNTRDKADRTPLHLACAIGNVAIVEKLLSWKALINVPDRENKTPLFKAIECGHEDCAKLLIQTKVGLTVYDKDGNSCLHHLCIHGMTALIPLVLDKLTVADTDKKNKFGQNPLHLAIEKNNAQAIEMLLKKGVSPNTYNQNNITPLMMACYRGHKDIVLQLLKHEADPSMKDSNGNTAADLAMKMGHEDCVKEIEYFHEKDANAEASDLNVEEEEAISGDKSSRFARTANAKEKKQMNEEEENEEDASWEESEAEGNDFYKGKANLMLSKILKEDHPPGGAMGGDPDLGVQLTISDKITKNMLMDCDDEEEDVDEEVTPLSVTEKKKEISALKDQIQFLSTSGETNDIKLCSANVHDQPLNAGTSPRSKETHQEDDESCWDTSCEDAPDNILNEQPPEEYFKDEKGMESRSGTFPLSEIKYPIVTEKFHLNSQSQNDKQQSLLTKPLPEPVKKSKDDSFPESSDEDMAPFSTMKQKNKDRRSSSIENQIGTFIKNNDLKKNSVKEEKGIRKSFASDWDSVSEKSSHTSDHSMQELKKPNETFISTSITESQNAMKQIKTVDMASKNAVSNVHEGISEITEELRALKVEVTSLKEVLSMKDVEVEQLNRNLKMLEDENVKLKTKPTKADDDDVISKEDSLLKEEVGNLQKELDKMMNKISELKELNEDLRTKLNVGNKSLDQVTQSHKIEVLALKKELTDLENKLKEHQQTKQQLESSNDVELRMNHMKLEEQLKYQMDACREHEMQLAEQKSKIMNLELDNNHLKMTLDGKTNQCNELEIEVNKLTSKHEDMMRELLAEKDKSIKMNLKSETQQERIDVLLKELENMRGMNHSISSSSEILLKAEYEQKVSLFEELNEDMKRTVSKLREELDLQRKKHEDEYKMLTFAKNELFNKLVLAETALKKESISKQFLESELQQLTKDSQTMKQKLSEEQDQRQDVELKMISLNQAVEASKSSSITIESKLNQKSEALMNVEKENEFLKSSLHKIELEKVKLDASLKMEQQQKENLQEELIDLKKKLAESLRESFEHHRMKKHLQEKVQDLAGSKDMALMEAENHREMWENEIKSKSKLGLRLFQLDHENRGVLTKLTQEQMKLRKALEKNHILTEELQMEKHRGNILSQKLDVFKISSTHAKNKVRYNHSRYLVDASCKKCKKNKDTEERIYSKDIMKEAERMKREIEQKTQTEFMEKLQQVYHFLEEQTIIRSRNEQKRMENLELYRNNLFISSDQLTPPFHKAFGLSDKPNKIQALFDELKLSENKLRDHLSSNNEAFHSENSASIHPTIPKGYSTEDILQQLEKSIKTCSSTI